MARVVQAIDCSIVRGSGTKEDPWRTVRQFWSLDGVLLMEHDPPADVESAKAQDSASVASVKQTDDRHDP